MPKRNTRNTALRTRLQRIVREAKQDGPPAEIIFDQMSVVAVVLDTGLRVVRFNRAAERLFGKSWEEVRGRPFDETIDVADNLNRDLHIQSVIALGTPAEVDEIEVTSPDTDQQFYFSFAIDPVVDSDARIVGVSILGVDVTELADLRRHLSTQNEDLVALQQVSNALRKTMDLDKALFIIASALTSHEGGGYDHAMIFTVDQDREFLTGRVCVDSIGLQEVWGMWRGLTSSDAPLKQLLQQRQPALAKRWGALTDVANSIRVPLTDESSIFVHAIRNGETVTAETMQENGLSVHEAIREHFDLKYFAAAPLLIDREAIGVIVVDASKRKRPFGGTRLTMLEMFADQAALAISNGMTFQSVLDRAQKDSLTGLFNHGHFQDQLRAEVDRALRYETPLSLIMLDIDHFKRFNDEHGHQIGDLVLRQTALLIGSLVRINDIPARYGGEEFAVLLPHTDYDSALKLAERLRSGIERKVSVRTEKGNIGVAASLGVASLPVHSDAASGLVAIADEAMYLAKESGRNQVRGADELDPSRPKKGKKTKRPTTKRPTKKTPKRPSKKSKKKSAKKPAKKSETKSKDSTASKIARRVKSKLVRTPKPDA